MPRKPKLPPGLTLRGKTYYACFRSNGRLFRQKLSTDLDASKRILNELRVRADCADFGLLDNNATIEEVRSRYDRYCRINHEESTCTRYRQSLDAIIGSMSVRKVSQISEALVNEFREARLVKVSPRTVNVDVGTLAAMLEWAVGAKIIGSNPLAGFQRLSTKGKERKKRRALSPAEVEAIFENSPDYLKPCWRMFATTGLRRGELTALEFSDVDFDRAVVTVRAENSKTGETREVPLDEEMLATIQRLRDDAPFRRPGRGNSAKDSEVIRKEFSKKNVFVTQANTPWKGRLLRRFYAICKKAGIEDARPGGAVDIHALRGTFTSIAMDGGANPKEVQAILGHSTLKMTMDAYAKSTDRGRRNVISALPFAKAAQPNHVVRLQSVPTARASEKSSSVASSEVVAG